MGKIWDRLASDFSREEPLGDGLLPYNIGIQWRLELRPYVTIKRVADCDCCGAPGFGFAVRKGRRYKVFPRKLLLLSDAS